MARPKEKKSSQYELQCEKAVTELRLQEAERLSCDMKRMLTEAIFADITIDGGTPLNLHKFVIRARSEGLLTKLVSMQGDQSERKPLHRSLNKHGKLTPQIIESLYTDDSITPALLELSEFLYQDDTDDDVRNSDNTARDQPTAINGCISGTNEAPATIGDELLCECNAGHCRNQNCNQQFLGNSKEMDSVYALAERIVANTIQEAKKLLLARFKTDGFVSGQSDACLLNGKIEGDQLNDSESKTLVGDSGDSQKVSPAECVENGTGSKRKSEKKKMKIRSSRDMRKKSLQTLLQKKYGLKEKAEVCSELGEDLLCALLLDEDCDCVLQVQDLHLPAHRCVLASRSSYFGAMLGGSWRESEQQMIPLEGVEGSSVIQLLMYLYGGVTQLIPGSSLGGLIMLSDMYDIQGLKDVLIFTLRKDYCHFFHKPCPGCISGVPDTLTLAILYHMEPLKDQCLKWISQHFAKVWPTTTFVSLPQEVLELCVSSTINDLAVKNVITTMVECQRLNKKTPHLKWTEPVFHMITRLMEASIEYASQNFLSIIYSSNFRKIDQGGLSFNQTTLEAIFGMIMEALSPGLSCETYVALEQWRAKFRVCDSDKEKFAIYSQEFQSFVEFLYERNKAHLCRYIHQAVQTVEWSRLPKQDQSQLITEANYVFIDAPSKSKMAPPKLTSMQKKISSFSKMSMKEYFDKHFPQREPVAAQPKITILKNERHKSQAPSSGISKPSVPPPRATKAMVNKKSKDTGVANKVSKSSGDYRLKVGDNKTTSQAKTKSSTPVSSVSDKGLQKKIGLSKKADARPRKGSGGSDTAPGPSEVKKPKSKESLDVYARAYKKNGHKTAHTKLITPSTSTECLGRDGDVGDKKSGTVETSDLTEDVAALSTPFIPRFGLPPDETKSDAAHEEVWPGKIFTAESIPLLTFVFHIPQ